MEIQKIVRKADWKSIILESHGSDKDGLMGRFGIPIF